MSIKHILLTENQYYKEEERFFKNHTGEIENIVSSQKIEQRVKRIADKYLNRFTGDETYEQIDNYIWEKLTDWHNKYEDKYYKLAKSKEGIEYDSLMAYRQDKAIKNLKDYILDAMEQAGQDMVDNEEYRNDLEWEWKKSRGV